MRKRKLKKVKIVKVPIRQIKLMSDEEWNKLAYLNALQRGAIR